MRSTRGRYHGHNVGSRSFRTGHAEYVSSMEYEEKQRDALRGRLEVKINKTLCIRRKRTISTSRYARL